MTEMLIATVIVIFGLVAVAQLVPTSVMMNSNNRNDGTALTFAQREMEMLRSQPLTATSFTDPQGGRVGLGALLRYALLNLDLPPPVKLAGGVAAAGILGPAWSMGGVDGTYANSGGTTL